MDRSTDTKPFAYKIKEFLPKFSELRYRPISSLEYISKIWFLDPRWVEIEVTYLQALQSIRALKHVGVLHGGLYDHFEEYSAWFF